MKRVQIIVWIAVACVSLLGCSLMSDASVPPTPSPVPTVPTATATSEPTTTPEPQAVRGDTATDRCAPPGSWTTYRVTGGDTISGLAQRTGTTITALIEANCLENADLLEVGQTLYLPFVPPPPAQQPQASTACVITATEDMPIYPLPRGTGNEPIGILRAGEQLVVDTDAANGTWGGWQNGRQVWVRGTPTGDCSDVLDFGEPPN